jgi:hypothetical protein
VSFENSNSSGASRDAGAPLMFDFLDTAKKLSETNNVLSRDAFEDVFDAQSELQGIFAKAKLDIHNIETLFGAIEMGLLLRKFGSREPDKIAELRSSIITLIVETLEASMRFPVRDNRIYPSVCYGEFAKMLMRLRERRGGFGEPEFAFITFNYDLGLDYALSFHGDLKFDHCLGVPMDQKSFPYLKLHGSINWGYCRECKQVILYSFTEFSANKFFHLAGVKDIAFKLGSQISERQHCNKPLERSPVLIPPTWNKTGYHQDLAHVWQKGAEVLGAAENIFVIGYSLPETDSFFRYLYALGSQSRKLIKRFWVFNPDQVGTEPRFQALIGEAVSNRFCFYKETFAVAIGIIESELKKD